MKQSTKDNLKMFGLGVLLIACLVGLLILNSIKTKNPDKKAVATKLEKAKIIKADSTWEYIGKGVYRKLDRVKMDSALNVVCLIYLTPNGITESVCG